MLLHQGAASFERWTGVAAPIEIMREALSASLT
jgi:shikimate 5-dehydrogenase